MGKFIQKEFMFAKQKNDTKRRFLLTFFDPIEEYSEKFVNGFYLIKQYNKKLNQWNVAIFDHLSFYNRKNNLKKRKR